MVDVDGLDIPGYMMGTKHVLDVVYVWRCGWPTNLYSQRSFILDVVAPMALNCPFFHTKQQDLPLL